MKYTFHETQSGKNGVISNTHGFLYRHLDTGFSSKWDGFWAPPYKFIDYFSFQINGIWLNEATLQGVEYGDNMIFHHETDTLEIQEKLSTTAGFPGFKVEIKLKNKTGSIKAVQTLLETGIDIRSKNEDVIEDDYSLEVESNSILAERCGKKLVIDSEDITGFNGHSYSKEHFPGNRQVCLIPDRPVFRKEIEAGDEEVLEIDFRTSEGALLEIESPENVLDHDLGRAFSDSLDSLENLVYSRNGVGIIAGHPWFQSYWARDSFWSVLGLIDGGYFDVSEQILENFARRDLNSKIQLEENHEENLGRADTAPLFVIAADKLRRHEGISEELEDAMQDAMDKLELQDKIVDHDPDGTWMDTIEREKAVDIQSLWLEAARITGDERTDELEEGLEKFVDNGLLKDELEGGHATINPAVPLMFRQVEDADGELERINGEFSSRYGARTRSMTDPGYDSSGYHTGSVWGLTTCWAAAANFSYGRDGQGINSLKKLGQFLDKDQPGALPEVVDAESGELLGAPEQAWSAGLMVHVIDSYMLGIKVREDHVEIDPAEISCTRKGKLVRGERLDLKIEEGEVEILNDPDLDLRF